MSSTLDFIPSQPDVRRAVRELKRIRDKAKALDLAVDAIAERRIAHLAEQAIASQAGGRGLHRFTGKDTALISAAIAWLNSGQFRTSPAARTHLQPAKVLEAVQGSADASERPI